MTHLGQTQEVTEDLAELYKNQRENFEKISRTNRVT